MKKQCAECGSDFEGRSDKKFCSDQCRSAYNNRHRSASEQLIKKVNAVLRKNRTILKTFNPSGMTVLRKEVLSAAGFHYSYFTSRYITADGNEYWFCYDVGYMHLPDDKVRIVEYQPYMNGKKNRE